MFQCISFSEGLWELRLNSIMLGNRGFLADVIGVTTNITGASPITILKRKEGPYISLPNLGKQFGTTVTVPGDTLEISFQNLETGSKIVANTHAFIVLYLKRIK